MQIICGLHQVPDRAGPGGGRLLLVGSVGVQANPTHGRTAGRTAHLQKRGWGSTCGRKW